MGLKLDDATIMALRRHRGNRKQSDIVPGEDAVAIYGGLGEGLLITLDGRIIEEDWFDNRATEVIDPLRIRAALVLGARLIPELGRLIPQRPETAVDCHACHATGWRSMGQNEKAFICPTCGGVGWADRG